VAEPTPTPTADVPPEDDIRFPRGDGNCDANLAVNDVTAALRGLGSASSCGNDDCNRDGEVTEADINCTARCLFGECPVPLNAPGVLAVEPDSAPSLAPGSRIRLTGSGLFSDENLTTVTIGGQIAPIADVVSDDEIFVVVPPLEAGPADVVVTVGDIASVRLPIEVSAPSLIGKPDTFDSTMDLVDEIVRRFAGLDLSEFYGEDGGSVADALEDFRLEIDNLRDQLDADPEFSADDRARLDQLFESSGASEELRALLDDLDALDGSLIFDGAAAGPTGFVPAFKRGADTIRLVAGAAETAGGLVSATALTVVGVAVGLTAAVLIAADDPLTPLIYSVRFRDRGAEVREYASPGGTVDIEGARFDSFSTLLELRVGGGTFTRRGTVDGDVFRFPLPDAYGFCGPITLVLSRTPARIPGNPVATRVRPELEMLRPSEGISGTPSEFDVRGFIGCRGALRYERTPPKGSQAMGIAEEPFFKVDAAKSLLKAPIPRLVPGGYRVVLEVAGLRSAPPPESAPPPKIQEIENPFFHIDFECTPEKIAAPPSANQFSECEGSFVPGGGRPPIGSELRFRSNNVDVAMIAAQSLSFVASLAKAVQPGKAIIFVDLVSQFDSTVLVSGLDTITVVDETAPEITVSASVSAVDPGATFDVTVRAEDNVRMQDVSLNVTGDAVQTVSPSGTQTCPASKTCERVFTITVKESGFTDTTIELVAAATDTAANSTTSDASSVTVSIGDDRDCPVVTIAGPRDGSTIEPGLTVRVDAAASDGPPGDPVASGVVRFLYTASGPALVSEISRQLPLLAPQLNPALAFNFRIKSAEDLAGVSNRDIIITVQAEDAVGNACEPTTITVRAGSGPSQCGVSPRVAIVDLTVFGTFDGPPESTDFNIPVSGEIPGAVTGRDVRYAIDDEFPINNRMIRRLASLTGRLDATCTTLESFEYHHREDSITVTDGFRSFSEITVTGQSLLGRIGTSRADFEVSGPATCDHIATISLQGGNDAVATRSLLSFSCNEGSVLRLVLERGRVR
jgi:hypothetical protein